jgi:hypothetical protein
VASDVFVSYCSSDKPVADAVCAALEQQGIRCWMAPRDVLPGAVWSEAIVLALEDARLLVVVFSAGANASAQVVREVQLAVSLGRPVLPLRIEPVDLAPSFQYFLGVPHWLDAMTPPLEQHLGRLVDAVGRLLERPVVGLPPVTPTPRPPEREQPQVDEVPPDEWNRRRWGLRRPSQHQSRP